MFFLANLISFGKYVFCPVREEVSQSSMAKTTKQMRRNVQATIFLIGWHWSYTESSFWRTDSTEIRSSGLYSQSFSVKSHTLHSKDWIEVPVLVFIHYFIRHCWSTVAVKDSHEVRATGRENAFDLSKYTFCLSNWTNAI